MHELVLAHCWQGDPQQAWYPWARAQLEQAGWRVQVPQLPRAAKPDPSDWLKMFSDKVHATHAGMVLAGHSLGCATVLHYIEQLPVAAPLAGVVLVAPFAQPLGIPEIDSFHARGFDWPRMRGLPAPRTVILGGRDPYLGNRIEAECRHFSEQFGADVVLLPEAGHFSHAAGCRALPEFVAAVQRLVAKEGVGHEVDRR